MEWNDDTFLYVHRTPRPQFAVNVPKDLSRVYINNARERYAFRFNGILGVAAKQDEAYERVAKRAVTAALEGYNSTVFAYVMSHHYALTLMRARACVRACVRANKCFDNICFTLCVA